MYNAVICTSEVVGQIRYEHCSYDPDLDTPSASILSEYWGALDSIDELRTPTRIRAHNGVAEGIYRG